MVRSCARRSTTANTFRTGIPYEDYRTSYAARADLGGGVVLTQIHDYDLAWWLFGAPRTVTATGGHLSDLEIDVEDTVDARARRGATFRCTIRQSFAVASAAPHASRSSASTASVTVDLLSAPRQHGPAHRRSAIASPSYQRNQMFVDEARHFRAVSRGRERPPSPLDDGIAVLRVALAVKDAHAHGGHESLMEP